MSDHKLSTRSLQDDDGVNDESPAVCVWGATLPHLIQKEATHFATLTSPSLLRGITEVSASHEHVLMVTSEGAVLCFGHNFHGQLAEDPSHVTVITEIQQMKLPYQARHVATGEAFSLFTLDAGYLYGCGKKKQLGIGLGLPLQGSSERSRDQKRMLQQLFVSSTEVITFVPIPLGPALLGKALGVSAICAKRDYSVISSGKDLWHFGYCRYMARNLSQKEQLQMNISGSVKKIVLGNFFGALLTTKGKVYAWGDGTYGELGEHLHSNQPVLIKNDEDEEFTDICAGSKHLLLVTANGLRGQGDNSFSQLGIMTGINRYGNFAGERVYEMYPVKESCPFSGLPARVFCGDRHSAYLTTRRRLFFFGDKSNGRCANVEEQTPGDRVGSSSVVLNSKYEYPHMAYSLLGQRVQSVALGAQNSVVVLGPPCGDPQIDDISRPYFDSTIRNFSDCHRVETSFGTSVILDTLPVDESELFGTQIQDEYMNSIAKRMQNQFLVKRKNDRLKGIEIDGDDEGLYSDMVTADEGVPRLVVHRISGGTPEVMKRSVQNTSDRGQRSISPSIGSGAPRETLPPVRPLSVIGTESSSVLSALPGVDNRTSRKSADDRRSTSRFNATHKKRELCRNSFAYALSNPTCVDGVDGQELNLEDATIIGRPGEGTADEMAGSEPKEAGSEPNLPAGDLSPHAHFADNASFITAKSRSEGLL